MTEREALVGIVNAWDVLTTGSYSSKAIELWLRVDTKPAIEITFRQKARGGRLMKTRELIALLQEEDPSGETEVSVGSVDIHFVGKKPAYYDGCLQVLKRDPANKYYNIIGGELRASGDKIVIHVLSIKDALWEDSDLPVTFDGDYSRSHYSSRVEEWRKEVKEFEAEELATSLGQS